MRRAKKRPLPSLAKLEGVNGRAHLTILAAYAKGRMPRATAMRSLGFTWYGQLLDALGHAGMSQPIVPIATMRHMAKNIDNLLAGKEIR